MRLLEHVAKIEVLTEAWERLYAGKSDDIREHSQGIDEESLAAFKKNDDTNIQTISKQLLEGKYKLLPLSGFPEAKKNGKFRLISAPCVRDRIVHAAILSVIQEFFPEIRNGSSYCLPRTKRKSEKVNFIDAFKTLVKKVEEGNKFVFESDIESFFDRIVKKRLLARVLSSLPDSSINKLITGVIYFTVGNMENFKNMIKLGKIKNPEPEAGLSQGSPLSPLFANIYLSEFDSKMIKKFQNRYIRYVDDFIVLCSDSNETIFALEIATKFLKKENLTLPPVIEDKASKTRTSINLNLSDEFVFLGIKVSKEGIRPNFLDADLKNYIDKKCFAVKRIKMILQNKKRPTTNSAKEEVINTMIQSKFGVYGYFHTESTLALLNPFITAKAKQSMLKIKIIALKKRGMPIVSLQKWRSYFKETLTV